MSTSEFHKQGRTKLLKVIEDRRQLAVSSRAIAAELQSYGAPSNLIADILKSADEADKVADDLEAKGDDWIAL